MMYVNECTGNYANLHEALRDLRESIWIRIWRQDVTLPKTETAALQELKNRLQELVWGLKISQEDLDSTNPEKIAEDMGEVLYAAEVAVRMQVGRRTDEPGVAQPGRTKEAQAADEPRNPTDDDVLEDGHDGDEVHDQGGGTRCMDEAHDASASVQATRCDEEHPSLRRRRSKRRKLTFRYRVGCLVDALVHGEWKGAQIRSHNSAGDGEIYRINIEGEHGSYGGVCFVACWSAVA